MRVQHPVCNIYIYYKILAPVIQRLISLKICGCQARDPGDSGIVPILIQQNQDPGRADVSVGSPKTEKNMFYLAQRQSGWRNFPLLAVGSATLLSRSLQAFKWLDEVHPREGEHGPLLSLLIQTLILSRNTLTEKPRLMFDGWIVSMVN